jgi:hypothetical protein
MANTRSEPAPFDDVVLICSKCAAKLGRGRKGKTALKGEVKDALKRLGLGKRVRVAEITCLDLCPKNGQTIALGSGLAKGRLWVVDADADGDTVAKLVLEGRSPLAANAG